LAGFFVNLGIGSYEFLGEVMAELFSIVFSVLKAPFIILNLIFRAIFRLDTKESIQAAHLANLAEIRKTSRIHMIEEEKAEKARVEAERFKDEAKRVKTEEIKSKRGGVKNGVISSLEEDDEDDIFGWPTDLDPMTRSMWGSDD